MLSKIKTYIPPLIIGVVIIILMILEKKDVFYSFDRDVTRAIVEHRGNKYGVCYWFSRILTEFSNFWILISLLIIFGFYFKWDYRVWYLVVICLLTIGLNASIKAIVARDRPPLDYRWMKETSHSFPSTHSAIAMGVYFSLFMIADDTINNKIIKNIVKYVSLVVIVIVPITRVVLGVHYTTDVVAGLFVGLFVALLGYNIYFRKKVSKTLNE